MRLARLRYRATKFLLHGTFLRPPALDAPRATWDLSRLSIYSGQKGGITSSQGEFPLVLTGSWQAADGNIGIALASISDEPLTIKLNLDPKNYPLTKMGTIYRICESSRRKTGKWSRKSEEMIVDLSSRGACLIEPGSH